MKPSVACAWAGAALAGFACLLLAQRPAAMTRGSDVPLEVVAHRADLVVRAKVVEMERPRPVSLQAPGELQPRMVQVQLVRLEVLRVFKENASPFSTPATRKTGTGNTPVSRPAASPGEKPMQVEAYVSTPVSPLVASDAPELQNGKQYLLVLYNIPGRVRYYLPDDPRGRVQSETREAERMEMAVDVNKWAWGPAVGGLETALLMEPVATLPKRGPLYLHGLVALRNVSDHAIAINLDPADKPLEIVAAGEKDARVKSAFYERPRKLRPGSSAVVTVGPGAVVFLGPSGVSDFAWGFEMALTPGRWRLQCGYKNLRETLEKKELWLGEINSGPVAVEVRAITGHDAK